MCTVVLKLLFLCAAAWLLCSARRTTSSSTIVRAMCRQFAAAGGRAARSETVRAEDGLALSSRNRFLSADERAEAPALYAALRDVQARPARRPAWTPPRWRPEPVDALARAAGGWTTSVRPPARPQGPAGGRDPGRRTLVALAAASWAPPRLIDNLEL